MTRLSLTLTLAFLKFNRLFIIVMTVMEAWILEGFWKHFEPSMKTNMKIINWQNNFLSLIWTFLLLSTLESSLVLFDVIIKYKGIKCVPYR